MLRNCTKAIKKKMRVSVVLLTMWVIGAGLEGVNEILSFDFYRTLQWSSFKDNQGKPNEIEPKTQIKNY